jgi:hypothetical protein
MRDEIGRFALRVLAWLAPCFAAWFLLASWQARPAAWIGWGIARLCAHPIVEAVQFGPNAVTFLTSIAVRDPSGAAGTLVVEVNPLLYTYGTALFAALMLASRARIGAIAAGIAFLLPFQAWGIAFDFLVNVGVRSGPAVAQLAGIGGGWREAVALAYQLGALILPVLAPVALWAAMRRPFIASLVRPASGPRLPSGA